MTINEFDNTINNLRPIDWKPVRHMQALIGLCEGRYSFVLSYSTRVALIDNEEHKLLWARKYSPTTSRQLTAVAEDNGLEKERV